MHKLSCKVQEAHVHLASIRDMEGMCNELAEKKVLDELLQQHPFLLTKLSFASSHKSALHIAAAKGNEDSVAKILNEHPELAEEVDSQKASPLHIAAAKGHKLITAQLLLQAPNMCWSRDCHGMNPVHVAAVKGHVGVLDELVKVQPFAAVEKLDRGENALHLCVKHGHLEALKVLVKNLDEVNGVDNGGETLLHWAVRYQNVEIIKYLMHIDDVDEKSKNSKGQTAFTLLLQSPSYKRNEPKAVEIEGLLQSRSTIKSMIKKFGDPPKEDLSSKRDSIMVVAVLIGTMAFQAVVSPPGGVWQDDTEEHKSGESVMAFNHPNTYKYFMRSNTMAFVTSLTTILLLISGLPHRYRFFMWTLTVTMWASVTAVGFTYTAALYVVTPRKQRPSLSQVVNIGILVWSIVMGILFVINTLRLLYIWSKNLRGWLNGCCNAPPPPHPV